ncbi:MAG: hypothetical protein R3B72_07830 [Polyangiaceae bacterium]
MGAEKSNPQNHLDAVYSIFHAGPGAGLPTEQNMASWVAFYELWNPTLAATDAQAALAALQKRECVYIVDTSDMTIAWKECSCTNGCNDPSISRGLDELDALLGN